MEEGIPISIESQAAARASGLGAEEIQDLHLREWVLLAWTQCEPHPSPSPKGEVNNYQLSEEEDMQMPMAAEE